MVGELIAQRRKLLGLSQTELGRRTGTSQRQVSRLENGEERTLPRRDTLDKFGTVLGIGLAEFYRAAGVLETEPEQAIDTPVSPDDPIAIMVERVRRNPAMMRDLRRAQEINDPAKFELILEAIADAWLANLRMGLRVNDADKTTSGTGS